MLAEDGEKLPVPQRSSRTLPDHHLQRSLSTAGRWATIAAGGQAKHLEGFGPPVDGFDQVPLHDSNALRAAIGPETAAILIEPVQGEGGITPVRREFPRGRSGTRPTSSDSW